MKIILVKCVALQVLVGPSNAWKGQVQPKNILIQLADYFDTKF